MTNPSESHAFEHAASRVLKRVMLRRWLAKLGGTVTWAAGGALLALVLRIGLGVGAWLPWSVVGAWLLITAVIVWQTRPDKYAALAYWDDVNQRCEAFASAWWFHKQPNLSDSQNRLVTTRASEITAALAKLPKDLPISLPRRWWLVALLLLAGLSAKLFIPLAPGDQRLTDSLRTAVASEAKKIATNVFPTKKLTGLTEQEKREVEKLQQDVQKTAKDIEQGRGESARGVLGDLEKRARDAEKLAQKLGNKGDPWASESLITALRTHSDTADLGDAVSTKNTAQTAAAAQSLADQLKQAQLPVETRERFSATFRDVAKASDSEDRKRIVGEPVIGADNALQKSDPTLAAKELERLAEKMSALAKREQAQRELEKLAQQLRDSGSRIAGQQGGGMEKMPQTGQTTAQATAQASAADQAPPQLQPPGLAQQQPQNLMPPQDQQNQQGSQQSTSLGQGQSAQGTPSPNAKPGQAGKPMLFAPVPGAKPEQQPSAVVMAPNAPTQTKPDGAVAMPGSGPKAGNGTAKLDAEKTAAKKSRNSAVVDAKPSTDGPSSSRTVEGGVREEGANRPQAPTTTDFIKEQEAAMEESALPASRRDQVRRYFGELRKRFNGN